MFSKNIRMPLRNITFESDGIMMFLWIVLLAGGLTLLITGTLPIGRFPNFAS